MTDDFPGKLFGQPVKRDDDNKLPRYPIAFGDPADAYVVKRRISGEEVIEAAREVFGFDEDPDIILTRCKSVQLPAMPSLSTWGDNLGVTWEDEIESRPAPKLKHFDKWGKQWRLCRFVGRLFGWNWLCLWGQFGVYDHQSAFRIVRIDLEEHELPDGFSITMGYDAETNTLAVLSEGANE